jgi:hypothetical protein
MPRVRALRGVCIGVGRHLTPADDPVELDAATAQFLVSLGAVERVSDAPNVASSELNRSPRPRRPRSN